jgi:hypothetical protein
MTIDDSELQHDVLAASDSEPGVGAARIAVSVDAGCGDFRARHHPQLRNRFIVAP